MCASMDEVKQREALIDQLKNNCSDDLGDIVGLLLNFKNSGKQVIANAEAVCVASAKILNEATQLGDSKQELANILTLEKPEKEHVTVALEVMAQLVSTDDGAEAKNTEQVKQELSAIFERCSRQRLVLLGRMGPIFQRGCSVGAAYVRAGAVYRVDARQFAYSLGADPGRAHRGQGGCQVFLRLVQAVEASGLGFGLHVRRRDDSRRVLG